MKGIGFVPSAVPIIIQNSIKIRAEQKSLRVKITQEVSWKMEVSKADKRSSQKGQEGWRVQSILPVLIFFVVYYST